MMSPSTPPYSSKYERKISKADKYLQDIDGGPQGCDGDAGPRVPGQSKAHLGGEDGLRFSGPNSLQSAWYPDACHSPPTHTGTKGTLDFCFGFRKYLETSLKSKLLKGRISAPYPFVGNVFMSMIAAEVREGLSHRGGP